MRKDTKNAEHPYRKIAISLIEELIEPLLADKTVRSMINSHGLNGELYYKVEDKIVEIIINTYTANKKSARTNKKT